MVIHRDGDGQRLLTVKQIASVLKCAESAVHKWLRGDDHAKRAFKRGKLPCQKQEGRIYIRLDDLKRHMDARAESGRAMAGKGNRPHYTDSSLFNGWS